MSGLRRALLIGVGSTPGAAGVFESLDEPVAADLRVLREALEESGYQVQVLDDTGRAAISASIFEAAQDLPEDGTLLIHFTGHGLRIGETDYLVPADARAPQDGEWKAPYLRSLLPADISEELAECRSGTVLWVIDACRNTGQGPGFGSSVLQGPPSGRFAALVSCSPGQQAHFTTEGSLFTRALAQALSSMTPPKTVQEVFEAAEAATLRFSQRTQQPRIRYSPDHEPQTKAHPLCEGRQLLAEWQAAVTAPELWRHAQPGSEAAVARLQKHLGKLVERCALRVHQAQQRIPDPWTDDDFPVRLLRRGLPPLLPADCRLDPVEIAALAAAPFLREAAWAERLDQAHELSPESAEHQPEASELRLHLEQVQASHGHVSRRLAHCRERERPEDLRAVALWLVHRWVRERFEVDEQPVPTHYAEQFALDVLGQSADDSGRADELVATLCLLAAEIGVGLPLADDSDTVKVYLPEGHQSLRVRPLSALLRLAGVLATDVRHLPDVIADHLAVTDPVHPGEIVKSLQQSLRWEVDEDQIHLDLPCPHPALHAAMAEMVGHADRLAAHTRSLAGGLPDQEKHVLAQVPSRVTDRRLKPRTQAGRSDYELPLLAFHLAQTEVRELLMGRQLYGDPKLAVRELYQNAMDACRYREMRWRYLEKTGWRGAIRITQGHDERGRFIECEDNGVGMSLEVLKHTFSRAGSRFEQSRAFRREQAQWLRKDKSLRLYPNSRFGIGVLSYFMLADELSIVTRQVLPNGRTAEHALRVEISSSGSLFRIQPEPGDPLPDGGTRVRLYLQSDTELAELSCQDTLRELVMVAEFDLTVEEGGRPADFWHAGELRIRGAHRSAPHHAVEDTLWWVDGDGAILCDGIRSDRAPFGYVLNLTGAKAGRLSVNRNELLAYDEEWTRQIWLQGARSLPQWDGFTMTWLWELDLRSADAASAAWPNLHGRGLTVPVSRDAMHGADRLDEVGCFALDRMLITDKDSRSGHAWFQGIMPWRLASRSTGRTESLTPIDITGYPLPVPGDAAAVEMCTRPTARRVDDLLKPVLRQQALKTIRRLRIAHPGIRPGAAILDRIDKRLGLAKTSLPAAEPVLLSARTGTPLGRVARRVGDFVVPEWHEHYVCTEDDVKLLYESSSMLYRESSRPDVAEWDLTPSGLLEAAKHLDVPAEEIAARVDAFAWLGLHSCSPAEVTSWRPLAAELWPSLGSFRYWDTEEPVPWTAALVLAAEREITFSEAEQRFLHWAAENGREYRCRTTGDPSYGSQVPTRQLLKFSLHFWHSAPYWVEQVTLTDLSLWRAEGWAEDANGLEKLADELRRSGLELPDCLRLATEWDSLPLRVQTVFSGQDVLDLEEAEPAPEPTASVLLSAAAHLGETLGAVWETAELLAPGFGLSVQPLPEPLAHLRPTAAEAETLARSGLRWSPVLPDSLIDFAEDHRLALNTAFEQLGRYRELGALVPVLTTEQLALLADASTERHALAVSGKFRVTGHSDPLAPLDLLSIAGRLGEPMTDTWARIVPYLPLFPVPPEEFTPAPVLPIWQDFTLLAENLDGHLPAISGRVSAEHVLRCSVAVEESEAWVWGRLRLFAEMFGLELPSVEETGEEAV